MTATNLLATYNTVDTTDTVTISNIGGGQGAGTDADLFLQGDQAVSRRIDNSSLGWTVSTSAGGSANLSATGTHLVLWMGSITWSLVTNYQVVITSGTNQDAYHNVPSAQFPLTQGGFIPVWGDVTRTADGAVTNTPTLTAVNGVGIYAVMGNTAGNLKNVQADASFYGTAGYSLTGTSNIGQVLTAEENTSTGLKGVLQEKSGIYFCQARLIIGASDAAAASPVATTYSDSNITLIFPNQPLVATDFMGQTINLGNASTTYSLTGSTVGAGDPSGAVTRPDLIFTGTSGSATITNCTLLGMRTVDFTSTCTFDGGILDTVNITQGGSEIKNCEIRTRTATQIAVIDDATFGITSGIHDVTFKQEGSGHAIEFTSGSAATLTNIEFSGYGANASNSAAIYNNTGGSLTLTVSGGNSANYTIRNGTGASTTIVSSKTLTIDNIVVDSEVRVYSYTDIDDPTTYTELAGVELSGSPPTSSTFDAVTSYTDAGGNTKYQAVFNYNTTTQAGGVRIIAVNVEYNYFKTDITLSSSLDTSISLFQIADRNYDEGDTPFVNP